MKDDLERLGRWFGERGASLRWAPAAEARAIDAAEARLGAALPHDYRELLLLHDGQIAEEVSWLPGGGRFHALADCVAEWTYQQGHVVPDNPEPLSDDGRYYQTIFQPWRLPIAGNDHWDGDNVVLDLRPGPAGVRGQLLGFVTECDLVVLGEGVRGLLARYVELVSAGALVCVPVEGQTYAFEVRPADWERRTVYQTRWDALLDPAKPAKVPRRSRGRR